MKVSKCSYAIYRSIPIFLLIKYTYKSYNQKSKSKELQEEMLQVLGGLSTYYYCFKGMGNMFAIWRFGGVCNMR